MSPALAAPGATPDAVTQGLAKLDAASRQPWLVDTDERGVVTKLCGSVSKVYPGTASQVARAFLKENAPLFGLGAETAEMEQVREHVADFTAHVWYRRKAFGLPVLGHLLAVQTDGQGRVLGVDNDDRPPTRLVPGGVRVGEDVARSVAVQVGRPAGKPGTVATAELGLHVLEGGLGLPVWRLEVAGREPWTEREVLVSAADGTVLESRNLLREAWVKVFPGNPVVVKQDLGPVPELTDQADSATEAFTGAYRRIQVQTDSSPWLRNQFVDVIGKEASDRASQPNGLFDTFLRSNPHFEEANAFFHVDQAARFVRDSVGMLEPIPPSILVYAHGTCAQNAYYSPLAKAIVFGDGEIDAAEDGDVIMHEYGHAIQDQQVPGLVYAGDSGAIMEGWADFFSCSVSSVLTRVQDANYLDPDPAGLAEWWIRGGGVAVPASYDGKSLRRVDDRGPEYKHYPEDLHPKREVHADGEVWSRYLWEVRQGFDDTSTGQRVPGLGNEVTARLALTANTLFTPSVTFFAAARAMVTAEQRLSKGANARTVVQAAIKRGFLKPRVTSISPTFMLLGSTTPVQLQGEGFAGASGVSLSDGTPVTDFQVVDNTHISATFPPRDVPIPLSAIVANMATTSPVSGARITVDDHPNSPQAVKAAPNTAAARDLLLINGSPVRGNVEVKTLPGSTVKEVDVYRFNVVRGPLEGGTEKPHVYKIRTGGGTARDTILTIFAADGTTVLGSNDDRDPISGDRTSEVTVAATGLTTASTSFFARVELQTGQSGTYTISVVDPEAPDDHPNAALAARVPSDVVAVDGTPASGTIQYPGDADHFRFDALSGAVYDIRVSLTAGLSDSYLELLDTDGETVLTSNDDAADSFGSLASFIQLFQAPRKGTYFLRVRHADPVSATATGGYGVTVVRRNAALDVQAVGVDLARVSRGQTFPVTITVANSGTASLGGLGASLKFLRAGSDRTVEYLTPQADPANARSLGQGATAVLRYTVASRPTALSGLVTLDASVSALPVATDERISDPRSALTDTFTLQTPAILAIHSVTAVPAYVSRGQSVTLTVSVANMGEATALVSRVEPEVEIAESRQRVAYAVAPAPSTTGDNPDFISGGKPANYVFQVVVPADAPLGLMTLKATAAGTDANSGLTIGTDSPVAIPDSWTVQKPAEMALTGVLGPGAGVSAGRTSLVTFTIANAGEATLRFTTASFAFVDLAGTDRTLQYTVAPLAGNPTSVAGGGTAKFRYSLAVSPTAATTMVMMSATLRGQDANSGVPFTTYTAGLSPRFTVQRPAGLNAATLEVSRPLVSRGQTAQVTVTVENNGQAAAADARVQLAFAGAGGGSRNSQFTVFPRAWNPVRVEGGTRGKFTFDVAVALGATTGPVSITASASGKDANAGAVLPSSSLTSSWTVQLPATVFVSSVTARPAVVSRGQSLALTVTVRNTGEAAAQLDGIQFTMTDSGGASNGLDYTFSAAVGNPPILAGLSQAVVRYTAVPSSVARIGTLALGATALLRDANSGGALRAEAPQALRPTFRLGELLVTLAQPGTAGLVFFDEPARLSATVAEDTGVVLPASALSWTADGNAVGAGNNLPVTLAAGPHMIVLRAAAASGLATSATLLLRVDGPQPPVTTLAVAGTLRNAAGAAVGSGFSVTVRNGTRNVADSVATGADGKFLLTLSSTTSLAAAQSETLSVVVRDPTALDRVTTPSMLTVRARDLQSRRHSEDLTLVDLSATTLSLARGLNLISLPFAISRSGQAYDTASLLTDSQASFLVRLGGAGGRQPVLELPGTAGAPAPVQAGQGYLLFAPQARTVVLKGNPWPAGSRTRRLWAGPNLLGTVGTLGPQATCDTLSQLTGSSVVVRTRAGTSGRGCFETWLPGGAPWPLEAGKGYTSSRDRPAASSRCRGTEAAPACAPGSPRVQGTVRAAGLTRRSSAPVLELPRAPSSPRRPGPCACRPATGPCARRRPSAAGPSPS
ncbi:MAG: M36 family metallopeptidase [Candidatus Riflebacteria bacterium]|nr:M36 family metallopeptidase [Candidatus Riflebacteria bacterium]